MRGLSEPNGSWKMICISRRSARSRSGPASLRLSPATRMVPEVGSIRRTSMRPVVDLPQPDSPTRPSVWPRWIAKSTPSTARTAADLAREQDAAGDREVLGQPRGLDQRCFRGGSSHATLASSRAGIR